MIADAWRLSAVFQAFRYAVTQSVSLTCSRSTPRGSSVPMMRSEP